MRRIRVRRGREDLRPLRRDQSRADFAQGLLRGGGDAAALTRLRQAQRGHIGMNVVDVDVVGRGS